MPLRLLNYLINNSYYCWENYVCCKDHLESAKCIGGLSATSPLIPLKLYLPVLPALAPLFFKQPRITSCKTPQKIYDATHKVVRRRQAMWRVLFVTHRSGYNLSETRWISGRRPRDLRTVIRKFSSTKCRFVSTVRVPCSLFHAGKVSFSIATRITRSLPYERVNSRVSKLSIVSKLFADSLTLRSL